MAVCCERNVVILKESTLCVRKRCSYCGISVLVSCWFQRSFEVPNETPTRKFCLCYTKSLRNRIFLLLLKQGYQTREAILQVRPKDSM